MGEAADSDRSRRGPACSCGTRMRAGWGRRRRGGREHSASCGPVSQRRRCCFSRSGDVFQSILPSLWRVSRRPHCSGPVTETLLNDRPHDQVPYGGARGTSWATAMRRLRLTLPPRIRCVGHGKQRGTNENLLCTASLCRMSTLRTLVSHVIKNRGWNLSRTLWAVTESISQFLLGCCSQALGRVT